jgi:DnaK suppressor protein
MAAAKKAPLRKAAKPVAKKAVAKKAAKKPVAKKAAPSKTKVSAKKPLKPVRAAKPLKSAKTPPKAPVKPAAVAKAPAKEMVGMTKRSASRAARAERPAAAQIAAPTAEPTPLVATPKPVPVPSAKDLAAAHEYLLARSATRSEAPVMVNGRRLPTEGELLKMADTDYMNDQQLGFFKHRLQQMERELLQNADETTEHLRETVIVPDPADRATIEEEHALELRTRDRERKLLKKVQQALARIDSGEYGYCEETCDPIGIPRLLARPTATLSLEAQQRREMKQKMYGD